MSKKITLLENGGLLEIHNTRMLLRRKRANALVPRGPADHAPLAGTIVSSEGGRKKSQVEGGTPPEVDPMKMGRLLNPALTLWLVCIASMLATASVEGKPTAIKVRPLSRATRGPFISSTNYYSSRRDDDARRPR